MSSCLQSNENRNTHNLVLFRSELWPENQPFQSTAGRHGQGSSSTFAGETWHRLEEYRSGTARKTSRQAFEQKK